jgi:hypothetical protein
MNVVSFSTYLIVNGVGFDYTVDFVLIFSDAFVRTVILTFSSGQPALEVSTNYEIFFRLKKVLLQMENIAEAASCVVSSNTEKHSKEEVFWETI